MMPDANICIHVRTSIVFDVPHIDLSFCGARACGSA
jgi:hypothetical protein